MFSEKLNSWKNVIIGFAGFGFVLSLILGIIGGVLPGVIIFRAFIFAVVFAGISIVMLKLIEAFIPELLSSDSEIEDEDESGIIIEEGGPEEETSGIISGKNLDITIEGDEDVFVPGSEGFEELETVEGPEPAESAAPAGGAVTAENIEEVEEAEEVEEVETLETAEDVQEAAPTALPDIGAYSDSFEQPVGIAGGDGLGSIDGMGSGGAEILGGMHDTDEIVKAVKTVLKKDQEG